MTIELLVMRHAKSDWSTGLADFDRPLNARGIKAADAMATWLVDNGLVPDRIVSSSAARARATALAVMYECEVDRRQVEFERDLYHADAFTWMQTLAQQADVDPPPQRLLIAGHNPGLDDLVETLATTPPSWTDHGKLMTTAAIAHFEFDVTWDSIAPQSGTLLRLQRPR